MSVINDITKQIQDQIDVFSNKIAASGIVGKVKTTLIGAKGQLQQVLDGLLAKGGLLTQTDADKAAEALRQAKEAELAADKKKYETKFIVIGVGLVVVTIAGIIYFTRKKKK